MMQKSNHVFFGEGGTTLFFKIGVNGVMTSFISINLIGEGEIVALLELIYFKGEILGKVD